MGYLICGMITSGILARVTLLSVRGNFFHQEQAQKSNATLLFHINQRLNPFRECLRA